MIVARDGRVVLRRIAVADLPQISGFEYTVSIVEPMTGRGRLAEVFAQTGFWTEDAGALAITVADRLVGTVQFYRSGLCIHGYEIGYILHGAADRGKGYGAEALRMFTGLLFAERPACHRLQLIIETWNDASARLAEACGYQREGVLRKAGYSSAIPEDCFIYSRVRES